MDGHTVGHPSYLATCEQGWMAIRWAHPRLLASSALGWTTIRWVRTTSLANICLTRGDGHTVGSSQTPHNMKQGWMAIRWAHLEYLATCEQGWMAIRWAHPRLLASSALGWTAIRWVRTTSLANTCLTRGDGHTVGSSQTPCNLEQGGMAIRWAHPKYLATFNKGGWPYGGHIPDPLQNNLKRLGGHTVGTSQLFYTFGTN